MDGVVINWDHELFNELLDEYLAHTSRSAVTAINTKAYYIARHATRLTVRAPVHAIRSQLLRTVPLKRKTRQGKTIPTEESTGPLIAGLINAKQRKKGWPGLYGHYMEWATRVKLAARASSSGFLKSGWIPAIKRLEPFADRKGAPLMDSSAKQVGGEKGDATPATLGNTIVAEIVNRVTARRDKTNALIRYGEPGLREAFDFEAREIIKYLDQHLQPAADEFNRKAS